MLKLEASGYIIYSSWNAFEKKYFETALSKIRN